MTSTPVMGSKFPDFMGNVNSTNNSKGTASLDFQSFMNRESNGLNDFGRQNETFAAKAKTDNSQFENLKNDTQRPVERNQDTVQKTDSKENVSDDNRDETVSEVKDYVKKVADKISDEFDVTKEDIEKALEGLGLNFLALLDNSKMPAIVAELTGLSDTISIAMNQNLYESLTAVSQVAQDAFDKTANLLNISGEELTDALQALELMPESLRNLTESVDTAKFGESLDRALNSDLLKKSENPIDASYDLQAEATQEKEASFDRKISIRSEKQTINNFRFNFNDKAMEADVTSLETVETDLEKSDNPLYSKVPDLKKSNDPAYGKAPGAELIDFANNLLNKVTEALNETTEQVSYTTFDAANVLDQITESIKVNLTDENSEVNLRLHPETLGNVSVKVSANHEGVLTAQFTAQNESVKAIIESQAIVLKETLEAKGVTVEAVEVLVQSHEFERNMNDQSRDNSNETSRKRSVRRINLDNLVNDVASDEDDTIIREMMEQNGNTIDYTV